MPARLSDDIFWAKVKRLAYWLEQVREDEPERWAMALSPEAARSAVILTFPSYLNTALTVKWKYCDRYCWRPREQTICVPGSCEQAATCIAALCRPAVLDSLIALAREGQMDDKASDWEAGWDIVRMAHAFYATHEFLHVILSHELRMSGDKWQLQDIQGRRIANLAADYAVNIIARDSISFNMNSMTLENVCYNPDFAQLTAEQIYEVLCKHAARLPPEQAAQALMGTKAGNEGSGGEEDASGDSGGDSASGEKGDGESGDGKTIPCPNLATTYDESLEEADAYREKQRGLPEYAPDNPLDYRRSQLTGEHEEAEHMGAAEAQAMEDTRHMREACAAKWVNKDVSCGDQAADAYMRTHEAQNVPPAHWFNRVISLASYRQRKQGYPSRRQMDNAIFIPGRRKQDAKLFVVVDVSSSCTGWVPFFQARVEEMLQHFSMRLVTHDTRLRTVADYEKGDKPELIITNGGTSYRYVWRHLRDDTDPSDYVAVVHFTDLYTHEEDVEAAADPGLPVFFVLPMEVIREGRHLIPEFGEVIGDYFAAEQEHVVACTEQRVKRKARNSEDIVTVKAD